MKSYLCLFFLTLLLCFSNTVTAVEKAWGLIKFDSIGNPSLANSFNVTSVSKYSGIPWTAQVTLTLGFSNINYVVVPSVQYNHGGISPWSYYPISDSIFWMGSPSGYNNVSLGFVAFGN